MTNCFTTSGLFGELFGDAEIRTEFGVDAFVSRMTAFETAWTTALRQCGLVGEADAEMALAAIDTFTRMDFSSGSDRDGLPVPELVAALREGLPDGAARAIHTGSTSQDVLDTAMVLTCLRVLDISTGRLARILAGLERLGDRFGDEPLMARTRMQAALPATVGLRVGAWRRPLAQHLARAETLKATLGVVQIGGPIGTREVPADHAEACVESVADALGLGTGPVWHSDRSRMVEFGHWLTLVTGSLGKIGQDLALMAQQGVDEIALSGGGGSSAMAHKQNPIAAEAMVTLSRFVAGQQGVLAQALVHEQERSGTAWALEWLTLPAMAEATGASLRHAGALLASVERMGTPVSVPPGNG
ncbi:3-carboxy-cis,cis-muconate cycloisomerase [Rhizobiaceae bacterium]|nr:3-carboxy-cis,cis-muconate cycloisomerase [Rhizobiaceae bacterium]